MANPIKDVIQVNVRIIETCEELIQKARKFHKKCNKSRAVSTGVGIIGSAVGIAGIIVASIVTAGASAIPLAVPILTWTGFGIGAAGAAGGFGTEITDIFITRSKKKKLIALKHQQIEAMEKCKEELEALAYLMSDEENLASCAFPWNNIGMAGKEAALAMCRIYRPVTLAAKAIKYSKNGGVLAKLPENANLAAKSVRVLTKHPVFVGVGLGVVFAAIDLAFLYKSWTSPHDLEVELRKTIERLQAANFALERILQLRDPSRRELDSVFNFSEEREISTSQG